MKIRINFRVSAATMVALIMAAACVWACLDPAGRPSSDANGIPMDGLVTKCGDIVVSDSNVVKDTSRTDVQPSTSKVKSQKRKRGNYGKN